MKNEKVGLVIGRFQPFHNGHLKLIQHVLKEQDKVIIAIGSAYHSHTMQNPFTAGERHLMISKTLESMGINNFYIIPIPDINRYGIWVQHVKSLIPVFNTVYANNPLIVRLFKEEGYEVRSSPTYNKKELSGAYIRQMISEDEDWTKLVPREVVDTILQIHGDQRIFNISDIAEGERLQFSEGKE